MIEIKPGPELDRAVAEAIGLTYDFFEMTGVVISLETWCELVGEPNTVKIESPLRFRPSRDLNAAFEAAEKVGLFDYREGSWCVPCKVRNRVTGEQWWQIQEHTLGDVVFEWVTDEYPTPALAICAAVLKLREDEIMEGRLDVMGDIHGNTYLPETES